jgi:glucose uptake protein GlcU
MMGGWLLLVGGLAVFIAAVRIGNRRARGLTQGCGVLVAAIGGLLLLRRPGSSLRLPGYGPREWRQP